MNKQHANIKDMDLRNPISLSNRYAPPPPEKNSESRT